MKNGWTTLFPAKRCTWSKFHIALYKSMKESNTVRTFIQTKYIRETRELVRRELTIFTIDSRRRRQRKKLQRNEEMKKFPNFFKEKRGKKFNVYILKEEREKNLTFMCQTGRRHPGLS